MKKLLLLLTVLLVVTFYTEVSISGEGNANKCISVDGKWFVNSCNHKIVVSYCLDGYGKPYGCGAYPHTYFSSLTTINARDKTLHSLYQAGKEYRKFRTAFVSCAMPPGEDNWLGIIKSNRTTGKFRCDYSKFQGEGNQEQSVSEDGDDAEVYESQGSSESGASVSQDSSEDSSKDGSETGTSTSQEGGKFTGTEGDANKCISVESGVFSAAEEYEDRLSWYLVNSCDITVIVAYCNVDYTCLLRDHSYYSDTWRMLPRDRKATWGIDVTPSKSSIHYTACKLGYLVKVERHRDGVCVIND